MTTTAHITDNTTFVHAIDHGSFPNLESTEVRPLHSLLPLGPELSSERCRLSLLAEQLVDALTIRPPKEYKPTKPNDVAAKDRAYLAETFARLHTSLTELLLRRQSTNGSNPSATTAAVDRLLTSAEHKHFTSLGLLAALLRTALDTPKTSSAPPAGLADAASGFRSTLALLRTDVLSVSPQMARLEHGDTLHAVTSPHALSLLRETALALKQGAALLLALHAADQARDRSGRSGLHKEAVAEAKSLEDLAAKTLAEARERVKGVKETLGQGGWLDRVEGWMFSPVEAEAEAEANGNDGSVGELVRDVVGGAEVEEWTSRVVESWREGIKGFGAIKWE